MQVAPVTPNEAHRLYRLRGLGILDTPPQKAFDDIVQLAATVCDAPVAVISFVDEDRLWFKAQTGLGLNEAPRNAGCCPHAILAPQQLLVVPDNGQDDRFSGGPLIGQHTGLCFYAGAPIVTSDGFALGTVCVMDRQVRSLTEAQRQSLKSMADLVMSLLVQEMQLAEARALRPFTADHQGELMAAITAAGLDLISFIGPDFAYRYVNHRYLTYWGKNEADIVGRQVADLVGPALFESTVKPNLERAMAGEKVQFEAYVDFSGVGPRFVEVDYLPVRGDDGLMGVVVRSHDIHAIKQRKAQLRETVAMLEHKTLEQERFIHIISHDLKEPINTIANFAGLLEDTESLAMSDQARRHVHFVRTGALRAKSLLVDLLDFLHLDRHAVQRQPVDLMRLGKEIREDLSEMLERKGGRIEFANLHTATGDPTLLRILLQNLVSNGLKFSPAGRQPLVQIQSSVEQGELLVSVRDNGIGIPADQTEKIFGMFTRLHSRKEYEGSGLGLSICKRIADLHGGKIGISSELGLGSCFVLHLPHMPLPLGDRSADEQV